MAAPKKTPQPYQPENTSAPRTPPQPGAVSTTKPHPSQITEEVRIGSLPPTQITPGNPGKLNTITAGVWDEYVSAGGYAWYANYARSLHWSIDDITDDFGEDLYERMAHDPQISSLVNAFKAALLEDGFELHPRVDDEKHPDYQDAIDLVEWCQQALDDIEPGIESVLWDMADAILYGSRVAEIVWHYAEDPDGKTVLWPRSLKVKPRTATVFVCDAYYNVLGLLGLLPGMATVITPDLLITDLSLVPNFLPREKFLILTFRMRNSDPRGTSIARPAYNAWNLKMQAWPEYLKYLAQYASPSLWGTTPEQAQTDTLDAAGNLLTAPVTPEQAMVTQLQTIRNGAVVAFPFGSKVEPIQMAGDGAPFREFLDVTNREMAKAILGQTLATEEGKHMARAAATTHEDTKDSLSRVAKPLIERMLRRDLLRTMIRYNKPELEHLCPLVALGKTETRDFAATSTGVASLVTAGYLGQSQYPGVDQMLGLPARDLDADAAAEAEAAAQKLQMLAAAKPQPASSSGAPAAKPAAPAEKTPVKNEAAG